MIFDTKINILYDKINAFVQHHATNHYTYPLTGEFSLHRGQTTPDLYGMIDTVYILYTIGKLAEKTTCESRQTWAKRILACQDDKGWFSKKNLRGHSNEHATAYAISALKLLEVEHDEKYLDQIKPVTALLPILTSYEKFDRWITHLDFRPTWQHIKAKKIGWHYIWRGSHVGGGIAAIIGMTQHLFKNWWAKHDVSGERWFNWYFAWLDKEARPKTGFWQRAFWNMVYRKPTMIDMAGAVHFYWIYEAMDSPLPYPEKIIESTLPLQKQTGLYKKHPFCIDLDGNFCIIRAYLQLPTNKQLVYKNAVYQSAERNFEGTVNYLTKHPLEEIYTDSHGLPGALAALTECAKLPNFKYADMIKDWQHPLDKVMWL